jgi:hypothetical protein
MQPIPYETALSLAKLIDAAARQLNDRIAEAHNLGMTVETNLIEVRRVMDSSPRMLVEVATKVRPDQISLTPGPAQADPGIIPQPKEGKPE